MAHGLSCWKCGASLEALSLPLRRLDECKACHSELHVCRMCVEYDTRVAKHCREPTAEEVRDKTQANFCDHFKPKVGAYVAPNTAECAGPPSAATTATSSATQTPSVRADTVREDLDEARATMTGLADAGVDFDDVTETLEREGVAAFSASFHDALESLEKKARELTR